MLGVEASCPICHLVFLTDRSYAEHLEVAHELMDDEGTRTTLRAARSLAGDALVPVVVEEQVAAEPVPTVDPSRIYDPDSENPYLATALAVLVLLLLFGSGWTVMRTLGASGDDTVAAQEQGDGSSLDLAADKVRGSTPDLGLDEGTGSDVPPATEASPTETTAPATTEPPPAATAPPAPSPGSAPNRATAPAPPPTTAPPPPPPPPPPAALSFVPPTVSGLRLDECPSNRGAVATWRFSYVLAGGAHWAPSASATANAGRYSESRESRFRDISVTAIAVRNTLTGAQAFIDVPDLTSNDCP